MPQRISERGPRADRPVRPPIDITRRHLRSKARETEAAAEPALPAITGQGYLDGRHYTTFIPEVEQLQEEKRHYQALALLRRIKEATGSYVTATGRQPSVWCDEQIRAVEQAISSAGRTPSPPTKDFLPQ